MQEFNKTEDGVLDYKIDYSEWLSSDTIMTSTWEIPVGISLDSESFNNNTTTMFLSGGTVNTSYVITNEITTVSGRTDERCFRVRIVTCRGGYVI